MVIDPEYKGMIRTDAHALLRPKTGLKDMFIDLEPGTEKAPAAKAGSTIPISATAPDVNPDEILAELDADTRDYLKLLIGDAGRGLDGRGADLREVLRRFEPTHRDLARVNTAVATRRENLRHLITSLNTLNGELARRGDDLAGLVDSSAAVMREFASEDANVVRRRRRAARARCSQTTDTMTRLERYAKLLGPTAEHLRPAARALAPANDAVRPLAREAAPLLRDDIRPFVREARPVVRDLRPAARNLVRRDAGAHEVVRRAQPLPQPRRLQPERARGPERPGPPGGLPVLGGVGAAHGHAAVLELRRARHVPAGHDRRALRDDRAARPRGAAARVPGDADPDPHRLAACGR